MGAHHWNPHSGELRQQDHLGLLAVSSGFTETLFQGNKVETGEIGHPASSSGLLPCVCVGGPPQCAHTHRVLPPTFAHIPHTLMTI